MITKQKTLFSIGLSALLTGAFINANAQTNQFALANVLQSNMVIQQGKPMRLWGTAKPGDDVKINVDWNGKVVTTKADDQGNWIGEISVPKTQAGNFTPHTITVIDGSQNIKLDNLLIGDVWFCAGQSNMEMFVTAAHMMTYHGVLNYEAEIAAANFPNIRLYKSATSFKINPVTNTKGEWKECSPKSVEQFSAVAYFFGRQLFQKLNIPIGLVESAVPGASTQAFTKRSILEADTMLKHTYLDPQLKIVNSQKVVDTTGFFTLVTKPTLIYNGMVYPLFNLSIKGMIWYQGESNIADKQRTYIPLFNAALADWRKEFKQGDFPFYYVQIAPYMEGKDTTTFKTAIFREGQEKLLMNKNTGMAVTMDVGEPRNVHPRDKRPVGERLAYIALDKTYHIKTPYLGPHYSGFKVDGNTVTISFNSASLGSGLTTKDGHAPKFFFVAGDDHAFYPAEAKIVGNTVVLTSIKVAKPIAVRYAFTDAPVTNLENKEGLPALAFRTDNW